MANWIANDSRQMRLAVGFRSLGGNPQIRGAPSGVNVLVRDALERCGFNASNQNRFTGNSIITGERGVYAIGAISLSVVKIGWSDNIQRRTKTISQWLPVDVLLIGKICGVSIECERDIHRKMRQWNQRGEWFRLTASSRKFIEKVFSVSISDELADKIGVWHE